MNLLLNGESVATGEAEPVNSHNGNMAFGGLRQDTKFHDGVHSGDTGLGFKGQVDEARIYNRALTIQEAKALDYEFETGTVQDVFTYTVSDGTDTSSTTLTIDVNRVPEAISDTLSATEDGGSIVGQLEAIDRDAGETLTFTVESQPAEGSVTVNADGSYSFNPGADFQNLGENESRDVSFEYRVTDAQGDFSTATINVTVTGVNDAPTAASPQVTIQGTEDTTLTITESQLLAGSNDADGDTVTISNVSYGSSDGTLKEFNQLTFGSDTSNRLEVTDTLQSFSSFSLGFEYTSTGSHSGVFDTLLGISTISEPNAFVIEGINSDGSLNIAINSSYVSFSEINLHDGSTHNLVLTWNSSSGDLKLYDNQQLLATKSLGQGETIASGGKLIFGQEQDSYGGGFDAAQSLTNATLSNVMLSHDVVAQSDIEAGTQISTASSNLALNIKTNNAEIVDAANNHNLTTTGSVANNHHYSFTPNSNFNGDVQLNYDLADGTETTSTQATLSFSPVKRCPHTAGAYSG